MAKGKTVTIRVSEETFDEVKQVCSELGETYNFNQFVNQSLAAILDVIHHQGSDIPVPRFAMMARLMREFEEKKFSITSLLNADEAFMTSATNFIMPIIKVDKYTISNGKPGLNTLKFRNLFIDSI